MRLVRMLLFGAISKRCYSFIHLFIRAQFSARGERIITTIGGEIRATYWSLRVDEGTGKSVCGGGSVVTSPAAAWQIDQIDYSRGKLIILPAFDLESDVTDQPRQPIRACYFLLTSSFS
jgi:hypothetical protein